MIRITGIAADRPIVPISLYSALELATLVQGAGGVHDDMRHLPAYIRLLKTKVIDFKSTKNQREMPPASPAVSIAKKTLKNDKLARIAIVIYNAKRGECPDGKVL